jgi:hypothetical protein
MTTTRRAFVRDTALAGAGLAALPAALRALGGPGAGDAPDGAARFLRQGDEFSLATDSIAVTWSVSGGAFRALRVEDRLGRRTVPLAPDPFSLVLQGGAIIKASEMRVGGAPQVERLAGDPRAARLAERLGGQQVTVALEDAQGRLSVTWRGVVRDGSTYVRQEVTLRSAGAEVPVRQIVLVDQDLPGAAVVGVVQGSPIVAGNLFLGFEHPLAQSRVEGGRARSLLRRTLPLRPGTAPAYSAVIGTTPAGQLRRGFLAYVERERAHPYRPFLHYNSWYDIGYFSQFDEAAALDVIERYGTELVRSRGVQLDAFLFDDGWDDPRTLWRFHAGFPRGFTPLREAAARYGAAPGVWMSPWGGYGDPRAQRLRFGREQGYETNDEGFVLSGPRYYARFRETALEMIRSYGIGQFKIDGTGSAGSTVAGSQFDSDFDAAISLIAELRAEKPDLFVNLTTGTYPSPFWLRYADSTWRGGDDHEFAGAGTDRQRWITYRDGDTYGGVVRQGPLYPLNSLMLHGLIYARHARGLMTDPAGDFTAEVRSYFGTGTQLQEMYVTPSLLSAGNWDALAEAAKWSRRNADALVDTHWVGGDPWRLEPYGWASWAPAKATLVLRNPKDTPQRIAVDVADAFELPAGAPRRWRARSPWAEDRGKGPIALSAGTPHAFRLAPFEVLTLDVVP